MSTLDAIAQWMIKDRSTDERLEEYWNSRTYPSRDYTLQGLELLEPWGSVVELGCHIGPLMSRIKERWPKAQVIGIEPNEVCVQKARVPDVWWGELVQWLPQQPDNAVDVIVTHYTLSYIDPEDLPGVLKHCLRVCRKGLVFTEPTGPQTCLYEGMSEWQHPYPELLIKLTPHVQTASFGDHGYLNGITVAFK